MTLLLRPLLIFDGDCGFCRAWVARWRQYTGDAVDYAPYQEVADRFPQIAREAFTRAVHLVEPDGAVTQAAAAVFRTLELGHRPLGARCYRASGLVRGLTESAYRWVAGHRGLLGRLTRWFYGKDAAKQPFALAHHVGLRGLGLVYLVAFLSFWVQAEGLIGAQGILPFAPWLETIRPQVAAVGFDRLPTVLWAWPSDTGLHVVCALGVAASVLLLLGWLPALMACLLWVLYLSLTVVGQAFMSFQWENLLLEGGLLAALSAPWRKRLCWGRDPIPSRFAIFLFHALVFKLLFLSGWVKLASRDPVWHDLTALTYHYWTQPLPSWTAWYADRLPLLTQQLSCALMFAIELGLPFLIWMPRRLRHGAAMGFITLMLLIAVTGNFAYFNLLTVVLCFWLLDDRFWTWLLRRPPAPEPVAGSPVHRWLVAVAGSLLLVVSVSTVTHVVRWRLPWPGWVGSLHETLAPFRSVNAYGLFAVMTKTRPEVVLEGSRDGQTWLAYELPWKPGDPARRPRFVAPHQPRLDWQLWFAALGDAQGNPWVFNLMARLLEGSPEVLKLVRHNPFPDAPPFYIRAVRYQYRFATPTERAADGVWWKRSPAGWYSPPLQRRVESP